MAGLRSTPAAAASLLLNLEGVFTALLAWFVFRENFDRRIALGMVLIVAGGVVLSWHGGPEAGLACRRAPRHRRRLPVLGHRQQPDPQDLRRRPAAHRGVKGVAAGSVNLALALATGPRCRSAARSPARWPSASSATG